MSTRPLTFPSAALRVMPPPGAVCPATVRYGSSITICSLTSMVPDTPNTTNRRPPDSRASRRLPAPASFRFVTVMTRPPRPPGVPHPKPSAPGKAGNFPPHASLVSRPALPLAWVVQPASSRAARANPTAAPTSRPLRLSPTAIVYRSPPTTVRPVLTRLYGLRFLASVELRRRDRPGRWAHPALVVAVHALDAVRTGTRPNERRQILGGAVKWTVRGDIPTVAGNGPRGIHPCS